VPITRGIAPRGPSGTVIWLAVTVMTLYGFNQIRVRESFIFVPLFPCPLSLKSCKPIPSFTDSNLLQQITNEEKRLDLKERRESRMAILPYLMVEQDIAMQARIDESTKEEAKLMKDNPNWTVGEAIYSRRWRPPTLIQDVGK